MTASLYLPPGYRRNACNEAFVDAPSSLTYQPHVYALAGRCVEVSGATRVIDLGCGSGRKLTALPPGTRISVYDLHPDEASLRTQLSGVTLDVHRCDFERAFPRFSDEELADTIVICADVVEHLREPAAFLAQLASVARRCQFLFLSTPARDRARGAGDLGPPANPAHCQEWTLDEFVLLAPDIEDPVDGPVRVLADKCIAAIAQPIEWKDGTHTLEVSIGIAVSRPGDDPDSLLAAADKAMYEAKRRGRGGYALAADAWAPSTPPPGS